MIWVAPQRQREFAIFCHNKSWWSVVMYFDKCNLLVLFISHFKKEVLTPALFNPDIYAVLRLYFFNTVFFCITLEFTTRLPHPFSQQTFIPKAYKRIVTNPSKRPPTTSTYGNLAKMQWRPQLSNLWWMPNSVSIGFDTAMKTDSSRRFKRYPTTYGWVSSRLPFTVD